jgi:hypothetical protein
MIAPAVLGPAAPVGAAVLGFEIVAAASASNDDNSKSVNVTCPVGKVALGGQARAFGSVGKIGLYVNAPTNATVAPAAPTGWQAAAREIEPSASNWGVRVVALCAEVPGLVRVSGVDGPDHDDSKDAEATCPQGLQPVGGGARISGSFDTPFLQGTRPVGTPPGGWSATAEELGGEAAAPWSVQADVLCADQPDVQVASAESPVAPASFNVVYATCPFGTQALGGGGRVVPTSASQMLGLASITYGAAEWEAAATDVGASGLDWSAEALAICSTALTIHADDFESGTTDAW